MNTDKMMRSSRRAVGAVALALTLAACDNGLADININPNDPVEVGAEYLFPNAVEAAVSRAMGGSLNVDLTGLWAQHYAEFEIPIEDLYELTDERVAAHWSGFYVGPMQDLQEVIEKGQALGRPNIEAMGLIMKVWTASVITDLYGDIGYTRSLRGRDPTIGVEVPFDTQEEVYRALLDDLTRAVALLTPDGVTMPAGDILYGGNVERWRRFANSLRMRLAMRLSDVSSGTINPAAEFQAAFAAGGFQANADHAVLRYLDNGVNRHPVHVLYLSPRKHSLSSTLVDRMATLNDPRLPVYARPNGQGEYRGAPNASLPHEDPASVSLIGTFYSNANAPGILLSYAELLLSQAEAVERGWITGDAGALYRAGIRASMEFNGVAEGDIVAYLEQPALAYEGGAEGLRQIWLQKWIALFGNGVEAYSEWRRTGYPVLPIGPDALNSGRIPVRLFYPASETALNGPNVEAAKSRQGGATMNSRVWWDVADNAGSGGGL